MQSRGARAVQLGGPLLPAGGAGPVALAAGRLDPPPHLSERLAAIVDAWIDHLRDGVFPGGCFVTTASVEYDARPGPLHDDVAAAVSRWLRVLEAEARRAREAGDLPRDRDPGDVAFELHSLASGGSVAGRLTADAAALDRIHAAMRRAIGLPAR